MTVILALIVVRVTVPVLLMVVATAVWAPYPAVASGNDMLLRFNDHVGAGGAPVVVTCLATLCGEFPSLLYACTVKLYVVPAVSPVTERLVVAPVLIILPFLYKIYPVAPDTEFHEIVTEVFVILDADGCDGAAGAAASTGTVGRMRLIVQISKRIRSKTIVFLTFFILLIRLSAKDTCVTNNADAFALFSFSV